MSNIYIQEPPTNGKVLLITSVGDIDIELWSKEAPRACRNFVQLCMEGYYDGTIFHRVISGFIAQGGDPTGTGHGGESIYGHPFKDEIHSRLRFVRRGLVAMANGGPNDNGSQFFFTMGTTPELMNKHTIFGKVSGNTVFNMLKLQECEIGPEDRPVHPNKIIRTQILANPYDDIIPRVTKRKKEGDGEKKPKSKSKATKNFKLLSFGEEAEEDEEQVMKVTEGWKGKSKSSHDLTNDPRLSAVPVMDMQEPPSKKVKEEKKSEEKKSENSDEKKSEDKKPSRWDVDRRPDDKKSEKSPDDRKRSEERKSEGRKSDEKRSDEKKRDEKRTEDKRPAEHSDEDTEETRERRENIRKKLKREIDPGEKEKKVEKPEETDIKPTSRSDELKQEAKQLKKEIRESKKREEQRKTGNDENNKTDPDDEAKQLKKEIRESKKREEQRKAGNDENNKTDPDDVPPSSNDPLADFKRDQKKNLRKQQGVKGQSWQGKTLASLTKFKHKLNSAKTLAVPPSSNDPLADFKRDRQKYKNLRKQQGVKGQSWQDKTLALLSKFKHKLNSAKTLAVPPSSNDPLADFKRDRQKYKNLRKQQGVKGQSREDITLALLDKFKNKLNSAKTLAVPPSSNDPLADFKRDRQKYKNLRKQQGVKGQSWQDKTLALLSKFKHKLNSAKTLAVPPSSNDPLADFKRDRQKYKNLRKQQGVKGQSREDITLALLDKFKNKLNSAKTLAGDYSDDEEEKTMEEEEDATDLSWMHHKLQFDDKHHKVLDANVTDVERYEIFDPRNPLTKRRRDESKKSMKEKR